MTVHLFAYFNSSVKEHTHAQVKFIDVVVCNVQRDMWDNSLSWWSSVLGWCKHECSGKIYWCD